METCSRDQIPAGIRWPHFTYSQLIYSCGDVQKIDSLLLFVRFASLSEGQAGLAMTDKGGTEDHRPNSSVV